MSLTFVDRQGMAIDHDLWRQLFDDPAYTDLATVEAQGFRITCSWVGVVSLALEKQAAPFLILCVQNAEGKRAPKTLYCDWAGSEEAAMALWEDACCEFLNPRAEPPSERSR